MILGCGGAPAESYPKWVVNKKLMHEYTYGYVAAASTYKCPTDKSYWKPGAKVTSYGMGKYPAHPLLAISWTAIYYKKFTLRKRNIIVVMSTYSNIFINRLWVLWYEIATIDNEIWFSYDWNPCKR